MKLAGKLPTDPELNGLPAIEPDLRSDTDTKRVVLAIVDAKNVTYDCDSDEHVVTARLRRIEPLLAKDLDVARDLLRRAHEHRTGKETLPFELEEDLEDAFSHVDPDTGETREV